MKKIIKAKKWKLTAALVAVFLTLPLNIRVFAQTSSTNYRVEESRFGTGGQLDANSSSYSSQQSTETSIGNVNGTDYQGNAGFNTKDQPYLEVKVTGGSTDLGTLSPTSTATTTSTFYVRAYLASGYSVIMASDPPAYGTEQIDPMTTQASSSVGVEQFGINLRANTSPTTFGADPSQAPDSSFSYGYAAAGYDTPNKYKFAKNDVIARSDKSSGQTDFTISYIYNISALSPAGSYIFNQDLVVVGTY